MNICIIGTGYVGLPSGVGFAELGHNVVCIDKNKAKIDSLNSGKVTLYEDGLEELFLKNLQDGRIKFSTKMEDGVPQADLVILAVGTPSHPVTKEADLSFIYAAASEVAKHLDGFTVIATKSTVPVGTGDMVEAIISQVKPHDTFEVVSLPEFLREGYAVHDFFHPDRIVVGTDSIKAFALIKELYADHKDSPILHTSRRSSELIKYASNAFLAVKIHYINEIANLCEKVGAKVSEVAQGMGMDSRIGPRFLNAGPGYGGSCFPKDTRALVYLANQHNSKLSLVNNAISGNEERKDMMARRIMSAVKHINQPKVAILGLAFKNGTDDCRESPAVDIVKTLIKYNMPITVYDPKAMECAKELLGSKVFYANSMEEAVTDADVIAVLTEWDDFKALDYEKASMLVRSKIIIDLRNILDKEEAEKHGFDYHCIGMM